MGMPPAARRGYFAIYPELDAAVLGSLDLILPCSMVGASDIRECMSQASLALPVVGTHSVRSPKILESCQL